MKEKVVFLPSVGRHGIILPLRADVYSDRSRVRKTKGVGIGSGEIKEIMANTVATLII